MFGRRGTRCCCDCEGLCTCAQECDVWVRLPYGISLCSGGTNLFTGDNQVVIPITNVDGVTCEATGTFGHGTGVQVDVGVDCNSTTCTCLGSDALGVYVSVKFGMRCSPCELWGLIKIRITPSLVTIPIPCAGTVTADEFYEEWSGTFTIPMEGPNTASYNSPCDISASLKGTPEWCSLIDGAAKIAFIKTRELCGGTSLVDLSSGYAETGIVNYLPNDCNPNTDPSNCYCPWGTNPPTLPSGGVCTPDPADAVECISLTWSSTMHDMAGFDITTCGFSGDFTNCADCATSLPTEAYNFGNVGEACSWVNQYDACDDRYRVTVRPATGTYIQYIRDLFGTQPWVERYFLDTTLPAGCTGGWWWDTTISYPFTPVDEYRWLVTLEIFDHSESSGSGEAVAPTITWYYVSDSRSLVDLYSLFSSGITCTPWFVRPSGTCIENTEVNPCIRDIWQITHQIGCNFLDPTTVCDPVGDPVEDLMFELWCRDGAVNPGTVVLEPCLFASTLMVGKSERTITQKKDETQVAFYERVDDCANRGELIETITCNTCGSRGKNADVYECKIHGTCTPDPHRDSKIKMSCNVCKKADEGYVQIT